MNFQNPSRRRASLPRSAEALRLLLIAFLLFPTLSFALEYGAEIHGVQDVALRATMEKALLTFASKEAPSLGALQIRAKEDAGRLREVAVYNGYCDPRVEFSVSSAGRPTVHFTVELRSLFSFGSISCTWSDEDIVRRDLEVRNELQLLKTISKPAAKEIPSFRAGKPALGQKIIALDEEVLKAFRKRSFAFCSIIRKDVIADRETKIVDVVFTVQSGPAVRFGHTTLSGADYTKPSLFVAYQAWREGDLYAPKLLEETELALQRSGLFQAVQVEEAREMAEDGWALPITITATERKPRTVGAGVSYTSTFGGGISGSWEHRNVAGRGGALSTQVELWQKMRTAVVSYSVPRYNNAAQNLVVVLRHDQQHYMPFSSSANCGSILLDKTVCHTTNVTRGLTLERLESSGIIGRRLYRLVKIPLQISWSTANSPVDATRGARATLHITPAYQYVAPHFMYLINTATLTAYHSICEDAVTFAARVGFGAIFTALNSTIPLPDRFFGGSPNMLRGYKTGSVSPLNNKKEPVGGRSMLSGSLEARIRPQKSLGWAIFYDVGNVYRHLFTGTNESRFLLHSVGFGIRYRTPIGPLRFDLGVPLHRRNGVDPLFQLYFSIGQAF